MEKKKKSSDSGLEHVPRRSPEPTLAEILKPFHDRARVAEDRLTRLEAAFNSTKSCGIDAAALLELKTKLEKAKAEQLAEREKAKAEQLAEREKAKTEQLAEREKASEEQQKLSLENCKLRYQILHLRRALEDADKNVSKTPTI